MRSLLILVSAAALTLWLGGIVALFIFVQGLFSTDRVVAVQAAPILFAVFEVYQLILFAVAALALAAWRMVAPARAVSWVLSLVIIAGAAAVAHRGVVSPRMR